MTTLINHSGGAAGADMEWERQGNAYGVYTISYSFPQHTNYGANQKILTQVELDEGYEHVKKASKVLGRPVANASPYVRNLLCRNWFQVKNALAIYAISSFTDDSHTLVSGGTGWAVQMGGTYE
jgi:hypothetical protein